MIRVIIADDHPIVRHGLRRLLELEPDLKVVAEAADGAEVLELVSAVPCEVLVLDLSLPHIRGLELVHLLRERFPALRILVFSVQPEDVLTLHLLDAGWPATSTRTGTWRTSRAPSGRSRRGGDTSARTSRGWR